MMYNSSQFMCRNNYTFMLIRNQYPLPAFLLILTPIAPPTPPPIIPITKTIIVYISILKFLYIVPPRMYNNNIYTTPVTAPFNSPLLLVLRVDSTPAIITLISVASVNIGIIYFSGKVVRLSIIANIAMITITAMYDIPTALSTEVIFCFSSTFTATFRKKNAPPWV